MSQLMFEDIVDFVEDYPREFRAQFARMKNFDAAIRNIIERFHEKRQEVFDNSTQRPSEKLERLKSLDSEYLGKAEELQVKKLQILKALKHAVTVVQRKINDSVDAHRQELRFEHPGAAERIEYDSRQLDIDQDATVKQLYKDLIPSASGLSLNSSSSGGAGANNILTSLLEYVPTYYRSPGVVENTPGAATAGVASGSGGANNNELGDETESLGSTTHGGRVRSDGGGYDDKGNEKKRGRGRPRRNKELDDGGASTLSGIDEDEETSPAAGYSGLGTANSKGGPGGGGTNDEEVWCFCKQPSFGFMVACDGADGVGCAIEWFHGDCVHVREEDMENVERWFCPMCREKLVQMHAGNVSSEALNNSNVDANERAQNALETMSQATTTSSAAVNGKGRLSMVDDEASTSSVGEMGFSSNRKRKRPTVESSSKASSSTTTHHKKSKHPHQPPNGKAHIGRPPKKSHRKS